VGKLFERINADIFSVIQKLSAQEISACHFSQRVFAHATETTGSGSFPQRRAGFLLLLFFAHQRKVNQNRILV